MWFALAITIVLGLPFSGLAFPVSHAAWSKNTWLAHCKDVRTSFNPKVPLSAEHLTLTPTDVRFNDFVYWVWANKILEHQVEQVGGTEWDGPTDGVIFHWAPGSRWETHTVVPFKEAITHITEDHHWQDTMFKEFFEPFGPIRGVSIRERLSMDQAPTWANFLGHIGGPESPYYRYIFHQEQAIDLKARTVMLFAGQGVKFEYSLERYLKEAGKVLTDCKAYQFFQLYDLYGNGFASKPGWAGQPTP
jgi:hypothetical protein